jgi:hypothetical protein
VLDDRCTLKWRRRPRAQPERVGTMLIFKTLHILSMVAMVTIEIGAESLYAFTISRRDVRGLAAVNRLLEQLRAGPASIGAFISGVGFGLLTAATGGFDFLDGWLVAAYVLLVIFLVTTTLFLRGALKLGRAAVEAESGTRSADEVVRQMAVSRALPAFLVDLGVVVAFIADMVVKPF